MSVTKTAAQGRKRSINTFTTDNASLSMVKKAKANGKYYWSLPGISRLLKQVAQVAQPLNLEQGEQPDEQAGFLGHFETPCNTFATSCNTSPDSPNSPTKSENGPSVKESAMEKFWRENW